MAATKNMYEFTYIITPVLSEEQIKDTVKRVNKLIESIGGKVFDVDEWGSRRLAYQINKKRNGYYVNLYFEAPGESIPRLARSIEIDDNILRYLTLRMDKKMIQHYELHKQKAATAESEAPVETEVAE
ncbi:MAG: 30S ribosomal protein S6 [Bacteroidetes bacterium]|nr:30S ribosomal protein S6 [Bacteroidota bacterium]